MNKDSKDSSAKESRKLMSAFLIAVIITGAALALYVLNRHKPTNAMNVQAAGRPTTNNPTTSSGSPSPIVTPASADAALDTQLLRANANGELAISVTFPAGYHLNAEAPQHYEATITDGAEHLVFARGAQTINRTAKNLKLPLRLPLQSRTTGAANISVSFKVFYCNYESGGSCRVKTLSWSIPVGVTAQGSAPHKITAQSEIKL